MTGIQMYERIAPEQALHYIIIWLVFVANITCTVIGIV